MFLTEIILLVVSIHPSMVFLWKKRQGGSEYWYVRKTARVDGKVKVVLNRYIGTTDELLRRLEAAWSLPEDLELCSYPFGTTAAVLAADREIGFSRIVEEATGSGSTALAVLAFLAGRSEEPLSKNAMPSWFDRSWLKALVPDMPDLSCRSYLRHMDRLTPERVREISFMLAKRLVALGYPPSLVFFDPTNFSTEQQPDYDDPERLLPRCGHAKDGNMQAKLVGLAVATTDRHLPVFHEVYPGNENDAKLFQEVVESMVGHLLKLGVASDDLVFIFDKGASSGDGLAALVSSHVHFVTSLKRVQVQDLLARTTSSYRKLYATEQVETILGFRSKRTVMGIPGVVVVAFNESARKRQEADYERAKERFLDGCGDIASRMSRAHRGRRSTMQSVTERVEDILPEKWRGVFKYHVGSTLENGFTRFTVRAWVDSRKEAALRAGFGKTVVFTDRSDWTDERIVRTYFARSAMEEDMHVLKDVLLFPVMPIFHRLDHRIKVHAFLCVIGLLLYRYLQLKVEREAGRRLPIGRFVSELNRLRIGGVSADGGKTVRFVLEKASPEGKMLVKALGLRRFAPN